MLAAAPESRVLELFRLALIIAQSNRTVPDQLINYFNTVLSQARALDDNPTSKISAIMPEAIQLALDIRQRDELRQALQGVRSFSDITPTLATDFLRNLEELGAS